jgi:hypothetical protein
MQLREVKVGFFDSIKKATGLGLNAGEHYNRAWEKSVLLGPTKYGEAVALFQAAAAKAEEAGDAALAQRARANSHIYGFVASGKGEHLVKLREQLTGLDQIEQVGSRNEAMSAMELSAEIDARIAEAATLGVADRDHRGLAQAHTTAAAAFKQIFSNPLITYKYHSPDQHKETAQSRYFLHEGLAAWHSANVSAGRDPDAASGDLSRAMQFFNQAGDDSWSQKTNSWSVKLKKRRTCWVCHREFQGEDLHFESVSAEVTPYAVAVVKQLGQDAHSLDSDEQAVVLCSPCGSVVRRLADVIAERRTEALREEVNAKFSKLVEVVSDLQGAVKVLAGRISSLESVAHRH